MTDRRLQLAKIFVGGLHSTIDENVINETFSPYSEIIDSVIIRDPETKKSRGFGFITFKDENAVDRVLNDRPISIDGKQCEIKRAIPREDSNTVNNLHTKKMFVGNLPMDITPKELEDFFEINYGGVHEIELIYDKSHGSFRGFAFVTMKSEDIVDKIVIKQDHVIKGRKCGIKKAEPKGQTFNSSSRSFSDSRSRPSSSYLDEPRARSSYISSPYIDSSPYDIYSSDYGLSSRSRSSYNTLLAKYYDELALEKYADALSNSRGSRSYAGPPTSALLGYPRTSRYRPY